MVTKTSDNQYENIAGYQLSLTDKQVMINGCMNDNGIVFPAKGIAFFSDVR